MSTQNEYGGGYKNKKEFKAGAKYRKQAGSGQQINPYVPAFKSPAPSNMKHLGGHGEHFGHKYLRDIAGPPKKIR